MLVKKETSATSTDPVKRKVGRTISRLFCILISPVDIHRRRNECLVPAEEVLTDAFKNACDKKHDYVLHDRGNAIRSCNNPNVQDIRSMIRIGKRKARIKVR